MSDLSAAETGTPALSRRATVAGVIAIAAIAASLGTFFTLTGLHRGGGHGYADLPGRTATVMAYQPSTRQVILFGGMASGTALNDTWAWDGSGWTRLAPAHSPTARFGAQLALDPASGDLVLIGGEGGGTPTPPSVCPATEPNRGEPSPAVAPGLVGGGGGATTVEGDAPTIFPAPLQSPPARSTPETPVAPPQPVPCPAYARITSLTDTWAWNGADWIEIKSGNAPGIGARLVTDTAAGTLYALEYQAYAGYNHICSGGGGGSGVASGGAVGGGTVISGSGGAVTGTGTVTPRAAPNPAAPTSSSAPCLGMPPYAGGPAVFAFSLSGWHAEQRTTSGPVSLGTVLTDPLTGHADVIDVSQIMCPLSSTENSLPTCCPPMMGSASGGANIACSICGTATSGAMCPNPCPMNPVPAPSAPGAAGTNAVVRCPAPVVPPVPTGAPAPQPLPVQTPCGQACEGVVTGTATTGPGTNATGVPPAPPGGGTIAQPCCVNRTGGEVWTYAHGMWTSRSLAAFTGPVALATEGGRHDVVAIGYGPEGRYVTMTWNGGTASWGVAAAPAPPVGYGFALAYDAATGDTVLAGGTVMSTVKRAGQNGEALNPTTWLWDGSTWRAATTPADASPPATPTPTAVPSTPTPTPVCGHTEEPVPTEAPSSSAAVPGSKPGSTPLGIATLPPSAPVTPVASAAPSAEPTTEPTPTPSAEPSRTPGQVPPSPHPTPTC